MKNDKEIPTADTAEIEQLIERVKQGKLEQDDAQMIEKVLRTVLTFTSLLQHKNTSIRRLKQFLFGSKDRKKGKDKAKDPTESRGSGQEESSGDQSSKESASISNSDGDFIFSGGEQA